MNNVRAKFRVTNIERQISLIQNPETGNYDKPVETQTVKMMAVHGGSAEDNTYAKLTPWGELKLNVTNPEVVGFFELNQPFYLDFTPAPR